MNEHETLTSETLIQGTPGSTLFGDRLIFQDNLFNPINDTTMVGYESGFCSRTTASGWQCTTTISLAGGNILIEGADIDANNSTMAITGGTGIYANVRGDLQYTILGNSEYTYTMRLFSDLSFSNTSITPKPPTTTTTGYSITGLNLPTGSNAAGVALGVFFGLALFILFVFVVSVACVNDARRRQGRPPLTI